jgi:hypothetical protein
LMAPMPRPRPPHLHHKISRHGKTVGYVRMGKGPRIRIKAAYGTQEFDEAYRAAVAGERPQPLGNNIAFLHRSWGANQNQVLRPYFIRYQRKRALAFGNVAGNHRRIGGGLSRFAGEQRWRDRDADSFGGFQVDHELELSTPQPP